MVFDNHQVSSVYLPGTARNKGKYISDIHKDLEGEIEMKFSKEINNDIDVLFLCLGHGNSIDFLEKNTEMLFLVPKDYTKENLPKPNDKNIEFKEINAKKVAAISFGGWANDDKIATYKAKLIKLLDKENIEYTNKFLFLGYNAPMEVVNRKNEVIVELK